jgi:hypothetical protein
MAKIVIDESQIIDSGVISSLEKLARFFDRLDDPYRMPEAMVAHLEAQRESGRDTYYNVVIGYGPSAMSLRCMFKKTMLIMEFCSPCGERLMELKLHI